MRCNCGLVLCDGMITGLDGGGLCRKATGHRSAYCLLDPHLTEDYFKTKPPSGLHPNIESRGMELLLSYRKLPNMPRGFSSDKWVRVKGGKEALTAQLHPDLLSGPYSL